ncbi:MAG: squalene synthase HpnC [Zoogloeaceae bacterium]|nr:squalene synthase HpnC [Zoogloeaceae bacterium]
MSVDHYENFPVASLLLPPALRAPVAAIYHFARAADDIADEGDASPQERLDGLEAFVVGLDEIEVGKTPEHPVLHALSSVIVQHGLPIQLFRDLLDAFTQDVRQQRYANYPELLLYCRHSANPVGRLVLLLAGVPTPQELKQSDAICTALQLINFWQDVAIDWQKGRLYLPETDLRTFGVTEAEIAAGTLTAAWKDLMAFEIARSRALMESGAPLVRALTGRLGWEIRLTVQGGLRILEKIEAVEYDVFHRRPTLRLPDWFRMFWRACKM